MKTPAGAVERRLRIALLVDRFGNRFGGAEAYGVELMRVLGQRHDIEIVARDFDSDLPFPSCPSVSRLAAQLDARAVFRMARRPAHARGFDIVHSHMNGWAGEIQVMHVTPVRYNRLTRAKPLKRLTAWLSPRLATYLLLEKSRVRPAPERRVVAVSGLIMDQLHRSYGPAWPWTSSRPASSCPRPPTPPSARPCATGWAGTPTPSVACWWRATRCARLPALLDALGSCPRTTGCWWSGPTKPRANARAAPAPSRTGSP